MKIIKSKEVSAETFANWVDFAIGLIGFNWDVVFSKSFPMNEKFDPEDPDNFVNDEGVVCSILGSANTSESALVQHTNEQGDVFSCLKEGDKFHCFFIGEGNRAFTLDELMEQIEASYMPIPEEEE